MGSSLFMPATLRLVTAYVALPQHDLIDEYSLLMYMYRVVLGSGKKLFPQGLRVSLRLIESRPFPSGVMLMRVRSA